MSPLRRVRKQSGRTLREVANVIGYDPASLSRVERGQQTPTLGVAAKLARYYGGQISEVEILYPQRFMTVEPPDERGAAL